jgi:hypothetical protein
MRISPGPWTAHHFEPEWITIMAANGRVVCKIPNEGLTDDAELIEVVPQLVSRYLGTMPPYMSLRELVNNARAIT